MPKGAANHLHHGTGFDWNNLLPILEKYEVKIDPKKQNLLINSASKHPDALSLYTFDKRNY